MSSNLYNADSDDDSICISDSDLDDDENDENYTGESSPVLYDTLTQWPTHNKVGTDSQQAAKNSNDAVGQISQHLKEGGETIRHASPTHSVSHSRHSKQSPHHCLQHTHQEVSP